MMVQFSDRFFAGMMELADVQDLGSCAARRVGSTPTTRTKKEAVYKTASFLVLFITICYIIRYWF